MFLLSALPCLWRAVPAKRTCVSLPLAGQILPVASWRHGCAVAHEGCARPRVPDSALVVRL
eukprot:3857018-Pleurochrysis_carterae.AAC.1